MTMPLKDAYLMVLNFNVILLADHDDHGNRSSKPARSVDACFLK